MLCTTAAVCIHIYQYISYSGFDNAGRIHVVSLGTDIGHFFHYNIQRDQAHVTRINILRGHSIIIYFAFLNLFSAPPHRTHINKSGLNATPDYARVIVYIYSANALDIVTGFICRLVDLGRWPVREGRRSVGRFENE